MASTVYYDKNSQDFFDRTIHADVEELYQEFLQHVPYGGRILDAGCGVGRDSKFFLSRGYEVAAFDGSSEMAKIASDVLGKEVRRLFFQDMDFFGEFDAVWANASLLHVPYEELRGVIEKISQALAPSAIFYVSFKYGNSMRQAEDRTFFDMDEKGIGPYLEGLFEPLKIWERVDTRNQKDPSSHKSWLHIIARKV